MAIALVGLSWFQLYWINNVIQLSEERFEKDALASMYQVAQRLERNEMAVVAANSFAFFGTTSPEDKDTIDVEYNYQLIEIEDSTDICAIFFISIYIYNFLFFWSFNLFKCIIFYCEVPRIQRKIN